MMTKRMRRKAREETTNDTKYFFWIKAPSGIRKKKWPGGIYSISVPGMYIPNDLYGLYRYESFRGDPTLFKSGNREMDYPIELNGDIGIIEQTKFFGTTTGCEKNKKDEPVSDFFPVVSQVWTRRQISYELFKLFKRHRFHISR